MRLFSTVLLFMINIAICLTSTLENDTDNPLQRIARAAPTTRSVKAGVTATRAALKAAPTAAPSVNKKPATIRTTVERHMKLARIFNALYLQGQLADEQIDNFDVIAGIWNLKDKKVIDELISLKVDGLSGSLKTLDTAVKGFGDDVTQVADMKAMKGKLESLRQITPDMRKSLLKSIEATKFPDYILHGLGSSRLMETLKNNLAQIMLKHIEGLEKLSQTTSDNLMIALTGSINDGKLVLTLLPKKFADIVASPFSTSFLMGGVDVAETMITKKVDFIALSNLFKDMENTLRKLKNVGSGIDINTMRQRLDHIKSVSRGFSRNFTVMPIGVAFAGSRSPVQISDDLSDTWMKNVLNGGKSVEQFENVLSDFKQFTELFEPTNTNALALSQTDTFERLLHVSEMMKDVSEVSEFQQQANDSILTSCLGLPELEQADFLLNIRNLSASLNTFREHASSIDAIFKEEKQITQVIDKLVSLKSYVEKALGLSFPEFDAWRKEPDFLAMKQYVDSLSKGLFSSLTRGEEFVKSIAPVNGSNTQIEKVRAWLAKINLAKPECDPLFSLKVDKLESFNHLPAKISLVTSRSDIQKLLPIIDSLPKVGAGLEQLKSSSSSPQKPAPQTGATQSPKTAPKTMTTQKPKISPKKSKRSTSSDGPEFKPKDPQNLLEFAFSARSLELMEEVHRHDKAIETILKSGDSANKMIDSIVDPELKTKLKDVWKGFDATKASLKAIQGDIKKVFAKIGATMEESTLKEVGATYEELGAISKAKYNKIQLSGSRRSLMDIPSSNSDPNWKALEEAFEELERPASMDFEMSFAHFRKVPSALVALQDDLKNFFENDGSNDGEKGFLEKNLIIILCSVGIPVLISIIASVVGLVYYCKYYYDPEMKKKLPRDEDWVPTDAAIEKNYTYMQYQDDRFEINQRLPNGNTNVFNLMTNRDWDAVEELVKQGAILDATCNGNKHRTALYELVLMKEPHWCKFFLDAGADQTIHDFSGDDADTWADTLGYFGIFQRAFDERKNKLPERNLAYEPRPWNVLVFDAKCIPRKLRKKLPARIKQNTTWGYKEGMKLDDFTIIIMPKKYLHDEKTIALSDDDLMTYKLYGCAASLVNVSFFHELIKNPKKHAEIMSEDYNHWIFNTYYKKEEYKDTVFKHKTNIHRMQPKLFDGVMIWFYETKDKQALAKQDDWTEIIKFFGGKVVDKPIPDADDGEVPYHTMGEEYKDTQNCMWLIKYDDSKVPSEHIRDFNKYTVFKLGVLGACFSRYVILSFINDIFPRETKPTPENDTESTTGATTKDGDSTMSKTVGNNATAGTISISTTTSKLEAPGGKTKSQMVRATRNKMVKPKNFVIRKGGRKMSVEGATNVPVSLAAPATQPAKPKDNIRGRMSKQSAQKA